MSEDFTRQVLQFAGDARDPIARFDIANAIDPGQSRFREGMPEHQAFLDRRIAICDLQR